MLTNNLTPLVKEDFTNFNIPLLNEGSIIEMAENFLNHQETEEDEVGETYIRMPQFKLSERRNKYF